MEPLGGQHLRKVVRNIDLDESSVVKLLLEVLRYSTKLYGAGKFLIQVDWQYILN